MGKVISIDKQRAKLKKKKTGPKLDAEAIRMLKLADEIDKVILESMADDLKMREIAGILAHRLGTLLRHVDIAERPVLWDVCERVLKEQADIRPASDF